MNVLIVYLFVIATIYFTNGSVPLTKQKTFGHSIKNGHLPPATEVTTFQHNCSIKPCVITLIHIPSVYPTAKGQKWNWKEAIFRAYIDNEAKPSIELSLRELSALSGDKRNVSDGSPFGIYQFGRTAKTGGIYSTTRIPFSHAIKTTIEASPSCQNDSVYWFMIRGLECMPVILGGDIRLPDEAKLRIYRNDKIDLEKNELIRLATINETADGAALLRVIIDADGRNDFSYLEACMRFIPKAMNNNDQPNPIFLSSGGEDYFLSASYFDDGMFKTPNSGITRLVDPGSMTAYRNHDFDPILMSGGDKLVFRAFEVTGGCGDINHCPDKFCYTASQNDITISPKTSKAMSDANDFVAWMKFNKSDSRHFHSKSQRNNQSTPYVTYSTLVFAYEWKHNDNIEGQGNEYQKSNPIMQLWNLMSSETGNELVSLTEEDMSKLTDLVIVENPKIIQLLSICNLSKKVNCCDVPYKDVLVAKIRNLLSSI